MSKSWNYEVPGDPEQIPEEWVWERLRLRRDALLKVTDFHVLPDAPGNIAAWTEYRQALRDLPTHTTDPTQAIWPTAPGGVPNV